MGSVRKQNYAIQVIHPLPLQTMRRRLAETGGQEEGTKTVCHP